MGPRGTSLLEVRQRHIEGVERGDKFVGAPDIGEGIDHSGLLASFPHEALMNNPVMFVCIPISLDREPVKLPGTWVGNI